MSHAAKTLTDELAYLRSMHEGASAQDRMEMASEIAKDIGDLKAALAAMEHLAAMARAAPADVQAAMRQELFEEMYFSHWRKWEPLDGQT